MILHSVLKPMEEKLSLEDSQNQRAERPSQGCPQPADEALSVPELRASMGSAVCPTQAALEEMLFAPEPFKTLQIIPQSPSPPSLKTWQRDSPLP